MYSESGKRLNEERKWPRMKSTEELTYEQFMSKVSNPLTGEFYNQKDSEGDRIPQKEGISNCNYFVETIIRVKTLSNEEYLYSMGKIRGFDAAGLPVEYFLSKPEVWTRTEFHRERIYDNNTKSFFETTRGPKSSYEEYLLPFTPENVQILYEKRDKSKTGRISFYVKDEARGIDVAVKWSSIEESLRLLKEKEFSYLFNGQYIPEPVREQARLEAESRNKQGLNVTIPKIEETTTTTTTHDNKDIKAYS